MLPSSPSSLPRLLHWPTKSGATNNSATLPSSRQSRSTRPFRKMAQKHPRDEIVAALQPLDRGSWSRRSGIRVRVALAEESDGCYGSEGPFTASAWELACHTFFFFHRRMKSNLSWSLGQCMTQFCQENENHAQHCSNQQSARPPPPPRRLPTISLQSSDGFMESVMALFPGSQPKTAISACPFQLLFREPVGEHH